MVILKDDSYDMFIGGNVALKNLVLVVIVISSYSSVLTSLFPWYWPFKQVGS